MNIENKVTFRFKGQLYASTPEVKSAVFAAGKAAELAAAAKVPKDAFADPSFVEVRRAAIQPVLDAALAAGTCEAIYHKFEKAGLGKAPFHVVGFTQEVYVACQGAPAQPAGTCDYCGQGIMNVFHIQSSDGRRFKVGCDCVNKTDDGGLKKELKTHPEVLAHKRALEAKKAAEIFEALKGLIERNRALLASQPHPRGFTNRKTGQPLTRLDNVQWLFDNSGRAGRKSLLSALLRQGLQ